MEARKCLDSCIHCRRFDIQIVGSVLDLWLPFLKYLVQLEIDLSNHKSATLPNSSQGFYSAAESQPVEVEVTAFESYTPFFKQLVVADLGQANVGEGRGLGEQSPRRERSATQTQWMNPGALDQTSGYVLALSPEAPNVSNAPPDLFSQERFTTTRSQNSHRASLRQPHLPKNLDGSDRLPWDQYRSVKD